MKPNAIILLLFVCLFSSYKISAQTYNYTYTDPCTGNDKTIIVPINGNVTVGYYGSIGSFSYNDFTNGNFEAWASNIFSQYGTNSPCSEIVGLGTAVNVTQSTALNVIGILNSLSTISDISGSTNILGGSVNSVSNAGGVKGGGKKENKKNNNSESVNNTQTQETGSQNQTNNTGSQQEGAQNTEPGSTSGGSGSQPEGGQNTGNTTNTPQGPGNTTTTSGGNTQNGQTNTTGEGTTTQTQGTTSTQGEQQNSNTTSQESENSQTNNQTSGNGESSNNNPNGNTGSTGNNGNGSGNNNSNGQTEEGQTNTQSEQGQGKTNITAGASTTIKSTPTSKEGGKPTVVGSADFIGFNFKNSEVKTGAKATGGYTSMRWDGKRSYGALVDYTSALKGPNITTFYAWIRPKSIILTSGTLTIGFEGNRSLYGTFAAGQMFNIKKPKNLKLLYMATVSYGTVYRESFLGTALIVGGTYDFRVGKRFDIKLMNLMVYAPYVSYYNDVLLKSPYVMLPSIGTNIKITKKFKFNINGGGAWDLKTSALNYTITCGTRFVIGQ